MAPKPQNNDLMQLDKVMRAVKLRREGKTIGTIAAELGIKTTIASRMIAEGLQALQSDLNQEAELLRADIAARIEWAMECLAPEVELGKPFAVEKWISGHMSLAKLYGLLDTANNAPVIQNNITINNDNKPAIPDSGAIKAARLLQLAYDRLEKLTPPTPSSDTVVEGQVRQLDT